MENETEKTHYVIGGRSIASGISYNSDDVASYSWRDKNGTIKTMTGSIKEIRKAMDKDDKNYPFAYYALLHGLFSIVLACFHIRYAFQHNWTGWQIAGAIVFWLPGWWILTCVLTGLTPIYKKKEDLHQFRRNHGAEHMVSNAYRRHLELPTIQDALQCSRLSPACGCAYQGGYLFSLGILGTLIAFAPELGFLKIIVILLVTAVYMVAALGGYILHHPFMLLEITATAQPNEEELEVACAAFEALYNIISQDKNEK